MSFVEPRETRNRSVLNHDIFSEFNTSAEEDIKQHHSVDHEEPEEAQPNQAPDQIQNFEHILKR